MKPRSELAKVVVSDRRTQRIDPPTPPAPEPEVTQLVRRCMATANEVMGRLAGLEDALSPVLAGQTSGFGVDPNATRTSMGSELAALDGLLQSIHNRVAQIHDLLEV